jgi:hypothetical protein
MFPVAPAPQSLPTPAPAPQSLPALRRVLKIALMLRKCLQTLRNFFILLLQIRLAARSLDHRRA